MARNTVGDFIAWTKTLGYIEAHSHCGSIQAHPTHLHDPKPGEKVSPEYRTCIGTPEFSPEGMENEIDRAVRLEVYIETLNRSIMDLEDQRRNAIREYITLCREIRAV